MITLPAYEHLDELSPDDLGAVILDEIMSVPVDLKLIKACIQAGVDVNARDKDDWSFLHLASKHGHAKLIRILLTAGAAIEEYTNKSDYESLSIDDSFAPILMTPLLIAAEHGNLAAVNVLIEHGADINARSDEGATPLHEAAKNGHIKIAKALLAAGASLEAQDLSGWTPLHEAVSMDHPRMVAFLLECGADIHTRSYNNTTCLHLIQGATPSMVRTLLNAGAAKNVQDEYGRTPWECVDERIAKRFPELKP